MAESSHKTTKEEQQYQQHPRFFPWRTYRAVLLHYLQYLLHYICKCFLSLSQYRWQGRRGCDNEHFYKAVEMPQIQKKTITYFSFLLVPHSVWIQALNLHRFAGQGTVKEFTGKIHTVKVQNVSKCLADMGYEQNCWAKTCSNKVVNISRRNIHATLHFLPGLSPVKLRIGLSTEVFNEVVKCAEIF